MNRRPVSSEEAREAAEAAAELGIDVDELERRRLADMVDQQRQRRQAAGHRGGQWRPVSIEHLNATRPDRHKLDAATIDLGRRKVAELRKKLAQPDTPQENTP